MSESVSSKLTTILAADVEGYCRLMALDEAGTMDRLMACRALLSALISRHAGRIANTAGDGIIAEFPSVIEAVQCAVEIQSELDARNHDFPAEQAMRLRVGVHLGDVMTDGVDLSGEGVNLAARLEQMAGAGDVLISQPVYDQIHRKLRVDYDFMGMKQAHNLPEPVAVYRVRSGAQLAVGEAANRVGSSSLSPDNLRPPARDQPNSKVRTVAIYAATPAAGLTAIDLATDGMGWWPYPMIIAAAVVTVTWVRSNIRDTAMRSALPAGTIIGALVCLKLASDLIPPS